MNHLSRLLRLPLDRLPRTATAPFCPSEVQGQVVIDQRLPAWQKFLKFAGPGLLIS
ncbi:MAG: Nramp family divalent metal transporter, partial [Burkholderiaceae bacterium]